MFTAARRIASAEGLIAMEAAALLLASRLAFLLPAPLALSPWVKRALAPSPAPADDIEAGRRLARGVRAALRRLPLRALCLQRSLVLVALLRRRGLGGRMRIGVRKTERGVIAHAWVEIAGTAINDSPDVRARFAVLDRVDPGIRALLERTA